MLSLYLSFRSDMPPLAAMVSFLSFVLTFMSLKLMLLSVPLIFRLRSRGMVKFFSTGAKGREMSLSATVPVIWPVE